MRIALGLLLVCASLGVAQDLNQQLIEAAKKGDNDRILVLLSQGADVNAVGEEFGWTAEKWAGAYGKIETVHLLRANLKSFAKSKPQELIRNQDLFQMASAGFSEETIIIAINSKPSDFDTSIEALVKLKEGGLGELVIQAVMDAASGRLRPFGGLVTTGLPTDIGVYLRRDGEIREVEPEVLTWKTGGVMKSFLTSGLTKGHINGVVSGNRSPLQTSQGAEFIIVCPEGVSVVEYQLLKMVVKKNRREFRAVTGGIIHASSGAGKNLKTFQRQKLAPRTYKVIADYLGVGEYGFLPPGAMMHRSAVSIGKIYTFGLE